MCESINREFYYDLFEELWKSGCYEKAIGVYEFLDRPFCLTEEIAKYYENQGRLDFAMYEFEYLMECYQMIRSDFLPFPGGPVELYKLGSWYQETQPEKAERFLKLYLEAENIEPGSQIKHKYRAERILRRIQNAKRLKRTSTIRNNRSF